MILSDCIDLIRRRVNDEDLHYWTDPAITEEINIWSGDLFRQMADAHESYGLMRYVILSTDTSRVSQLKNDIFLYELPSWAWRIAAVRLVENNVDVDSSSEGQVLQLLHTGSKGTGWNRVGDRTIRVQGYSEAKTLAVWLQRIPARIFKSIASSHSATADELIFDLNVASGYKVDLEDDAYVGSMFEMTSFDGSRDPRGSILRCESTSKAFGTVWELTVTGRPGFPALVEMGDTFEMHVPIPNQHLLYLILRVCESLHQKAKNTDAIASLQPQIAHERERFIEGLQPRTAGITLEVNSLDNPLYGNDPDRDGRFLYY